MFLVLLDAFFYCAIGEHRQTVIRPRADEIMTSEVDLHWDVDICMQNGSRVKLSVSAAEVTD